MYNRGDGKYHIIHLALDFDVLTCDADWKVALILKQEELFIWSFKTFLFSPPK